MDLQYLPEDKKREEDPDIRKMLLESLFLVAQRRTVHGKTVLTHVASLRSSWRVSGAADGHHAWTTDVKG